MVGLRVIKAIKKRSGEVVPFDAQKIYQAVFKANIRIPDERLSAAEITQVLTEVVQAFDPDSIPTVEQIQDVVEEKLIAFGYAKNRESLYFIPGGTCQNPQHGRKPHENL